jgi:hypothetical protein
MDLALEAIQHYDLIAAVDQEPNEVAPDEARAAGDQRLHRDLDPYLRGSVRINDQADHDSSDGSTSRSELDLRAQREEAAREASITVR